MCFTSAYIWWLTPGESKVLVEVTSVRRILGDSLPAGEYQFTISAPTLVPSLPVEFKTASLTLNK